MAAKQHFNNFMIVVSGSRSEIKRLVVGGGKAGEEGSGRWGVLRGRRSKKERSRKCLSQIKCFPLFFPSLPPPFLRHCRAVQMGVLIMHHMNLGINLPCALKVHFTHMFNKFHPPHYCVYVLFFFFQLESKKLVNVKNTSTMSDCFQLEGEKRRWFG